MYPEQTLRNMTLNELVAYSETFSDIPTGLAKVLAERALQVISDHTELEIEKEELEEQLEQAENLAEEWESKLDILEADVRAAKKELDSAEPDLELIRMYLGNKKMDAIELGELIRKVLITGNTSSQRSADGTLNRYHKFDSKAVMDLIYYLQDEIDGVKEVSEKPTREEIDRLDNAIQFYEKKLSSPWCSPYNKKMDGGYLDRLKRLKESWVKGE